MTMPVADFKAYFAIFERGRSGRFALPVVNAFAETTMTDRVKQAASDLRAIGKTMFAL
jgi:hypothetical protein